MRKAKKTLMEREKGKTKKSNSQAHTRNDEHDTKAHKYTPKCTG
jgi:hypothetical protein